MEIVLKYEYTGHNSLKLYFDIWRFINQINVLIDVPTFQIVVSTQAQTKPIKTNNFKT